MNFIELTELLDNLKWEKITIYIGNSSGGIECEITSFDEIIEQVHLDYIYDYCFIILKIESDYEVDGIKMIKRDNN